MAANELQISFDNGHLSIVGQDLAEIPLVL
jgi:hypothetical protein